MKILIVAVEVAPLAKVGGLADVAGSLPKALRKLGHDVRIAMPAYKMVLDDPRWKIKNNQTQLEDGTPIYLLEPEAFKTATTSATVYSDGIEKYERFSEAVLQVAKEWRPDVIHCNDWHTGFIPVLMREKYGKDFETTAATFTIHNFAYQGEFGPEVLDAFNLPRSLFHPEHTEAWGRVNFLKSGCTYADEVNTVSPTYAKEIQTPEYGCKLEGLMSYLAGKGKLTGILNGIDRDAFNPATDPHLPAHYGAHDPSNKAKCREALLKVVGMQQIECAPILGVVSRLSSQKGLDLLVETAEALFALPTQLIVQGLGDTNIADALRDLEKRFPNNIRFVERFDEDMAQLVYAGSDIFLMPSSFEPCGLGQMIALRYGTIPVVRKTGGLADTIFEGQNGFVFQKKDPSSFLAAVARAAASYRHPETWAKLVEVALETDLGWEESARAYVDLYQKAANNRQPQLVGVK